MSVQTNGLSTLIKEVTFTIYTIPPPHPLPVVCGVLLLERDLDLRSVESEVLRAAGDMCKWPTTVADPVGQKKASI